jgi:hypothetical protein
MKNRVTKSEEPSEVPFNPPFLKGERIDPFIPAKERLSSL